MKKFDDVDYVPPTTSYWYKLNEPENHFRVIGDIITGFELWETGIDGKKHLVKRVPEEQGHTLGPDKNYFLAAHIWSYRDNDVRVLMTGSTIISKQLHTLLHDKDWGKLHQYDVVVKKTGERKQTRYTVIPRSKAALGKDIQEQIDSVNVNLENLYDLASPIEEST